MSDPVVLLLAAGQSTRYGADKRLVRLPCGRRLLDRMLDVVADSGLPSLVVLRPGDVLSSQLTVPVVEAPHAREGMGSSIAEAVSSLPATAPGCLILPVDLPLLTVETVRMVADRLKPGTIVQPVCDGRPGHPVAFAREYFGELSGLRGDRGAKSVLKQHPEAVIRIPVSDAGIYQDVDTPERLSDLGL